MHSGTDGTFDPLETPQPPFLVTLSLLSPNFVLSFLVCRDSLPGPSGTG